MEREQYLVRKYFQTARRKMEEPGLKRRRRMGGMWLLDLNVSNSVLSRSLKRYYAKQMYPLPQLESTCRRLRGLHSRRTKSTKKLEKLRNVL